MQTAQAYQIHEPGDSADRGLMYAEACFETFRVIDGGIFRWPAHMQRLRRAAAAFGLGFAADDELRDTCLEAAAAAGNDALVRVTLTGGEAPWGLQSVGRPRLHVQAMVYAPRDMSIALRTVDWPFPLKPRPAKFTADYAEVLRATRHWHHAGLLADAEEPLIRAEGGIVGGLTANVLMYRDGGWRTPGDGPGVLPGIVRQALLEAGAVEACPCPQDWLADCEAMALINAGSFVRAVARIDRRALSTEPGLLAPLWRVLRAEPGVPS